MFLSVKHKHHGHCNTYKFHDAGHTHTQNIIHYKLFKLTINIYIFKIMYKKN